MNTSNQIVEIFTDQILDPKDPMRTELERNGLYELADNIKQNGLINPITVRPLHAVASDGSDAAGTPSSSSATGAKQLYEVVAGHRRLSACRIAGILKIQCVVRELDDQKTFEVMAAENLERADVDPVDESVFIKRFIDQTGKDVVAVAKSLRRSVQWVESRLVVGNMPDYMQQHIRAGTLKLGAALALFQITDDNVRRTWVDLAARDGVSVGQAEYWLHGWQVGQLPTGTAINNPPDGYEPTAPQIIQFECALDGKKYDAATFRTFMIHNANVPIFLEIVKAYRAAPPPSLDSGAAE